MAATKPYARLDLTEEEFTDVRGCLSNVRAQAFAKWREATSEAERGFYVAGVARYDALLRRCDAILIADTSQDAEPDQDEDERDDSDGAPGIPDAYFIERAREQEREGELEIDDEPKVSRGVDPGAYVAAWIWVDAPTCAGCCEPLTFVPEDADEDAYCADCSRDEDETE